MLLILSNKKCLKATVLGNLGLTDINSNEYKYEDAWEQP